MGGRSERPRTTTIRKIWIAYRLTEVIDDELSAMRGPDGWFAIHAGVLVGMLAFLEKTRHEGQRPPALQAVADAIVVCLPELLDPAAVAAHLLALEAGE
jgi:hypothetical protein